jgi:hypothetical protein
MVLGVLVLSNKLAQDEQDAMVGLAELAQAGFLVLIQSPHGVGGDQQHATPDRDFNPPISPQPDPFRPGEHRRVEIDNQDHEQHARERRQRGVAAPKVVSGKYGGYGVETQQHVVRHE